MLARYFSARRNIEWKKIETNFHPPAGGQIGFRFKEQVENRFSPRKARPEIGYALKLVALKLLKNDLSVAQGFSP